MVFSEKITPVSDKREASPLVVVQIVAQIRQGL